MARWTRALVTGASSGIGEAMARQLHAEGTELVLVARSPDKLAALADEFGGDTQVLQADLTTPIGIEHTVDRIREEPMIDLLVNNAGAGRTMAFADDEALPTSVQRRLAGLF